MGKTAGSVLLAPDAEKLEAFYCNLYNRGHDPTPILELTQSPILTLT